MDSEIVESAKSQAAICSIFSSPTRVLILWALADSERSVGEIASVVGTSLQNTSQHLRLMKRSGILKARREAQTIYYRIAGGEIPDMCRLLIQSHLEMQSH
jgi:DNA-binding transcriptional ArsR family regulator